MNLTDLQKQQVAAWLKDGLSLAQVQKRLESEFGLTLTYMEVKFLVSDLQVLPKDTEPPKPVDLKPANRAEAAKPNSASPPRPAEPPAPPTPGRVRVSVDQLARPGAVVSGNVTFSDGKTALWYVDQLGRIGLSPKDKGYRPSANDMQEFQVALDQELGRLGY